MGEGGELRSGLREYSSAIIRRGVMADDALDVGLLHQLGPRHRDLVHQQIGALAVLDDVLVVARVAGEHRDAAAILDAIAVAGLDDVAVVDLEGDHLHAVLLIHRTVAVELRDVGRDARQRQLLVGDADLDVVGVGALEILHQPLGAGRAR